MDKINAAMLVEPLKAPSGRQFTRCTRIFNNGSLTAGGRLYGSWQSYNEDERLTMTIGGEPVCEIDIKASYLSIANAKSGSGKKLAPDPYRMIRFVKDENYNQERMRSAAKSLVNVYLSKEGEITKFPVGKKTDKRTGKTIPFKEQYGLRHDVNFYMGQIHEAFPFLRESKQSDYSLMHVESEIVVGAMLDLLVQGVVSYPVHDCLMVKVSDKEAAVKALQKSMKHHLDYIPTMDVSWFAEDGVKHQEIEEGNGQEQKSDYFQPTEIWPEEDDDFEVIEMPVTSSTITTDPILY